MKIETAILFALIINLFLNAMTCAGVIFITQWIRKSDTPKTVDEKQDGTGDTTK